MNQIHIVDWQCAERDVTGWHTANYRRAFTTIDIADEFIENLRKCSAICGQRFEPTISTVEVDRVR